MQRKKVIVTGCRGQLGIAVNKLYAGSQELELVNTDVEELDITNIDKVMEFVRAVKPYAIINCAAHTNVNACETDVDNAYKINAIGPRNLSIAAAEMGAKLMQISTDYVFAGNGNRPYVEFDATNPLGVYGASKLAGENFVREFAGNYFIIRTAWLYGWLKRLPVCFLQKIMEYSMAPVKAFAAGQTLRKKFSGWPGRQLRWKRLQQKNI